MVELQNVNIYVSILFGENRLIFKEEPDRKKEMFAALNLKSSEYAYDVLPLITNVVKSDVFVHPYRTRKMLYFGEGTLS